MDISIGLKQGISGAEFFMTKEKAISIASLFDAETSVVKIVAKAYKWIRFHKGEMIFQLYENINECIRILLPIST